MSETAKFFHQQRAQAAEANRDDHLRFVPRRDGAEVLLAGVIEVAIVAPYDHPRAAATWAVYLPGCPAAPQPAATLPKARAAALYRVAQWFEACGYVASVAALRKSLTSSREAGA